MQGLRPRTPAKGTFPHTVGNHPLEALLKLFKHLKVFE